LPMMNKTAQTELHRLFLLDGLPEPLTRSSSHLQIFDNYIEDTRLRLRSIRDPYTKAWARILQQRFSTVDPGTTKMAEIYLNDSEYAVFERFEGREIRKNRYFHEFDLVTFAFDVFLGDLWGLNIATVDFETHEELTGFEPPPFAVIEITGDPFFSGSQLVGKKFEEVQAEVSKVGREALLTRTMPDE
jgi:CYTH domain-containing protein